MKTSEVFKTSEVYVSRSSRVCDPADVHTHREVYWPMTGAADPGVTDPRRAFES